MTRRFSPQGVRVSISVVSQLYAPKYVQRPSAELADDTAARPVVHDEAFQSSMGAVAMGGGGRGGAAARSGVIGGVMAAPAPPPSPRVLAPSAFFAGKNDQGNVRSEEHTA